MRWKSRRISKIRFSIKKKFNIFHIVKYKRKFQCSYPWQICNSKKLELDRYVYNAKTRKFYPNEGYEYDKAYVDRISALVKNKINFSGQTVDNNYYQVLFGPDDDNG